MEAQLLKSLGNPVIILIVKEILKHRMCNVKKIRRCTFNHTIYNIEVFSSIKKWRYCSL